MKTTIVTITMGLMLFGTSSYAQKTNQFSVIRTINAPASEVWTVVGENYSDIAKSHPKLSGSHKVEGSPESGEGCVRVCSLNEDGSKYTKEKMVEYNPEELSFKAEIKGTGGLPLDTANSYMLYNVDPIDDSHSTISLTMVYRTKPALLGKLAKGKFKRNIVDYTIAIEHHVLTGEDVEPENFKEIKKKYL